MTNRNVLSPKIMNLNAVDVNNVGMSITVYVQNSHVKM